MTARNFEVILINRSMRIVCIVSALSAVLATRAALSCMPCTDAPLAIICKPMQRIAPC